MKMTQEEKQLLLKDLCARLPYGVIVQCDKDKEILFSIAERRFLEVNDRFLLEDCKPYLRPMSSMTEEELEQCRATCKNRPIGGSVLDYATIETFDWLNAHHFDYRGLIPIGLALEAKEGTYKTE